jgi:hypothetical protein
MRVNRDRRRTICPLRRIPKRSDSTASSLGSDASESVRRYVASDPNAIGYVPDSEADRSVLVLLRLG